MPERLTKCSPHLHAARVSSVEELKTIRQTNRKTRLYKNYISYQVIAKIKNIRQKVCSVLILI